MANFITVTGLEDMRAKIKELTGPQMESALRGTCVAGARVILDQAIANAPEWPEAIKNRKHPPAGTLKRSIIMKRLDEEATPQKEVYVVTVRTGRKLGDLSHDAYYASWVEYGHYFVPRKPKGISWKRHREMNSMKYVPAHPFMRPAFDAKKGAAQDAMQKRLLEKINEVAGD